MVCKIRLKVFEHDSYFTMIIYLANMMYVLRKNIWGVYKKSLSLHPLLEIKTKVILMKVATFISFKLNFKNIWCIQEDILSLHPLLKIDILSLERQAIF